MKDKAFYLRTLFGVLFMSLLFSMAALGGTRAEGTPNICVGVVSDIHVYSPESVTFWERTLRWYDDRKIDVMIVAGDLTQFAQVKELQLVADVWWRVFPDDCGADGRHVERVFIHGNHEVEGWRYGVLRTDEERRKARFEGSIPYDMEAAWQQCFHESYSPAYMKIVKGYVFLALHWGEEAKVVQLMEEAEPHLEKGKPFFYIQHPHPANTVYGPWAWGHDDGLSTKVFSNYPDAIAFSGHSHYSLTDESGIWQGEFTSIGTASLNYIGLRGGRENSDETEGPVAQMKQMNTENSKQGMLVYVYDDCVVIERHDFENDCPLAEDWVLPLPLCREKPYDHARRKQEFAEHLPAFAPNADEMIAVTESIGCDSNDTLVKQVTVLFPTALAGDFPAYDYEVMARHVFYDVTVIYRSKRVFAPGFFLPLEMVRNVKVASCVFRADELPCAVPLQFVITPMDCFGNRGTPIVSKTMKLGLSDQK